MREVGGMGATLPQERGILVVQPNQVSGQVRGHESAKASHSRVLFAKNKVIVVISSVLLAAALLLSLRSGNQINRLGDALNFSGRLSSPLVQEAPSATQWGCWESNGQGGGNCVPRECPEAPCPLR